jgi:hypothetical protein
MACIFTGKLGSGSSWTRPEAAHWTLSAVSCCGPMYLGLAHPAVLYAGSTASAEFTASLHLCICCFCCVCCACRAPWHAAVVATPHLCNTQKFRAVMSHPAPVCRVLWCFFG